MVVMALGHFGCAIIVTTSAAADRGDDLGHAGRRPHARIARRRSRQSHRSRRSRRSRSETGDTVWLPLPPPMVLMAWDTSPPSQSESLGREPDGVCSHLQMDGVCSHHQKQSCSRLAVVQSVGPQMVGVCSHHQKRAGRTGLHSGLTRRMSYKAPFDLREMCSSHVVCVPIT